MTLPPIPRLPPTKRGDTWDLVLHWRQPDGTPMDLTGCTARMQVRDAARALVASPTTITLDAAAGTVTVSFSPAITRGIAPGEYRTDVELLWADGRVRSSPTLLLSVQEDCTWELPT